MCETHAPDDLDGHTQNMQPKKRCAYRHTYDKTALPISLFQQHSRLEVDDLITSSSSYAASSNARQTRQPKQTRRQAAATTNYANE